MHEPHMMMIDDAPAPALPASPAGSEAEHFGVSSGEGVLKILADVEGQLTRLRSAQQQQDDAISSLTARSQALRQAEEDFERKRLALSQLSQQVDRDRQQFQSERDRFAEQCRQLDEELRRRREQVDELQTQVDRERSEAASEREIARSGLAELEKSQAVWQQHRQQAQEQLQKSQNDLQEQTAALQRAKADLETARSHWERQRQDAQAKIDSRSADLEKSAREMAQREADLRQQRDRLVAEAEQARLAAQQVQARVASLEQERLETVARLEQAERNVGELIDQVERGQHQLIEAARQSSALREQMSALQQREKSLEQSLEAARQAATSAEEETQELLRLADGERDELQARLNAREQEAAEASETRTAILAELEAARERMAALVRDVRERDLQIEELTEQVQAAQRRIDAADQKRTELAETLSEQMPQLERGAAAMAMVEEQSQQIDRLTKQLAESRLASDPAELERRDQRIADLTQALRQARGQNPGETGMADVEQHNARLERELNELRVQLHDAQIAAEEARRQVEARAEDVAHDQTRDAALAEQTARVAALQSELERLQQEGLREIEARLEEQAQQHQEALAAFAADASQVEALREENATLQRDLAGMTSALAEARAGAGASGPGANEQALADRLRAKAQKITVVAEHLRRRRDRLHALRRLIRARGSVARSPMQQNAAGTQSEQISRIERERSHLADVRNVLAASEIKMVRRWAVQRAAFTTACVIMLLVFSAAASWLVVNHLYPAQFSASVVLEARHRAGAAPLNEEEKTRWSAMQVETMRETALHQAVAKRAAERRLDQWSEPEWVAEVIEKQIRIDDASPGVVVFTMAGAAPAESIAFLDVFAGTLIAEVNRMSSRANEPAITMAASERKEDGRVRYAALNDLPVQDQRFERAMPIFGVIFGLMLIISMASYLKFMRAKRVFEEENAVLFQDIRTGHAVNA